MLSDDRKWPQRLRLLDFSRGLAALVVVIWHWQHFAYIGQSPPATFDYTAQPLYRLLRLFYEHGYLAVDYFFQLSGFVFFWLYRDALAARAVSGRHFLVQRVSRLYPLHFVTLLFVAGLQAVIVHQTGFPFVYQQFDAYHFILNLGFAQLWGFEYNWSFNGPSGSVSIEILLYAVFFLLARQRLARPLVCLGIALFAGWLWLGLELHHGVFRGLTSFFAGGLTYGLARWLSRRTPATATIVHLTAAAAWGIVLSAVYGRGIAPPGLEALRDHAKLGIFLRDIFPVAILFPSTLCSLALLEVKGARPLPALSGLGDLSYASYLLHFPLQICCQILVNQGLLAGDFYYHPVSLLLFGGFLLLLSWLSYRYFEWPAQQHLRKRLL